MKMKLRTQQIKTLNENWWESMLCFAFKLMNWKYSPCWFWHRNALFIGLVFIWSKKSEKKIHEQKQIYRELKSLLSYPPLFIEIHESIDFDPSLFVAVEITEKSWDVIGSYTVAPCRKTILISTKQQQNKFHRNQFVSRISNEETKTKITKTKMNRK